MKWYRSHIEYERLNREKKEQDARERGPNFITWSTMLDSEINYYHDAPWTFFILRDKHARKSNVMFVGNLMEGKWSYFAYEWDKNVKIAVRNKEDVALLVLMGFSIVD